MLYSFAKHDQLPSLPPVNGLVVAQHEDPLFLSALCQFSPSEAAARLAGHHKAYVAYLDGKPAAFGWVATKNARIGEPDHQFSMPAGHRYLWNFRTLPAFRGLGIYPHLLQCIIAAESREADVFWIMHAPENKASERGIRKAGFRFMGKVSVNPATGVIFEDESWALASTLVPQALGFIESGEPQATCWSCSSPYLASRKTGCCCEVSEQECNQSLFMAV